MDMVPNLVLYGTEYCHLCEEAESILRQAGLQWQFMDIAENEQMLALYGLRIPVVQRQDTQSELEWPFGVSEVIRFNA